MPAPLAYILAIIRFLQTAAELFFYSLAIGPISHAMAILGGAGAAASLVRGGTLAALSDFEKNLILSSFSKPVK